MRKLFKKALACCLVAALALTCFVGALTVSAAADGSAVVTGTTVTEGAEVATVKVTLTSEDADGIHAAIVTVSSDFGAIESVVDADEYYVDGVETAQTDFFVDDGDINGNTFLVQARSNAVNDKEINLNVTFKAETAPAAGTYPVTITAGTVPAASWNENVTEFTTLTGANIVVEADEPEGPVADDTLIFGGKNGSFGSAYSLLFYIKESVYNAYDELWIESTVEQYEGNTKVAPRNVILDEDDYRVKEDGTPDFFVYKSENYYQYELTGISAKEVANKIISTPKAKKDGIEYVGVETDYNLITYATKYVNNGNAFANAMIAFLNYAAAAQERFTYNVDNLANATLTEAQKVVTLTKDLTDDKTSIPSDWSGDTTVYGFNVSYESQVEMIVYLKFVENFDFTGKRMKFVYVDTFGDTITDYIDLSTIDEYYNASILTVRYGGIAAKGMRSIVDIVVLDENGNEISNSRKYSLTSYAFSKQSATDGPVSKAMIVFADAMAIYKSN